MVTDARPHVTKMVTRFAVTEEMLIDAGYEPSNGYWRRELARRIARGTLRAIVLRRIYAVRWFLATIPRRGRRVVVALRDRECEWC